MSHRRANTTGKIGKQIIRLKLRTSRDNRGKLARKAIFDLSMSLAWDQGDPLFDRVDRRFLIGIYHLAEGEEASARDMFRDAALISPEYDPKQRMFEGSIPFDADTGRLSEEKQRFNEAYGGFDYEHAYGIFSQTSNEVTT